MTSHGKKILTGLALAAFGVGVLAVGPLYGSLVLVAVVSVGLREFYQAVRVKNFHPLPAYGTTVGIGYVALSLWMVVSDRPDFAPAVFGIGVTVAVICVMIIQLGAAMRGRKPPAMADLAVTLFGALYVGGLLSYTLLLWGMGIKAFPDETFRSALVLFLAMWGAFGTDAGAYLTGKAFGKTLLLPKVSPNKTVEGSLGGLFIGAVGTILGGAAVGIPFWHGLMLGLLMGLMAQLGDLCESMFKREMQVKDSSALLGTHGGVLDRMDSLAFTAPTAYFYLLWLQPWAF